MNATAWRMPDAPRRASDVTSEPIRLVARFALASVALATRRCSFPGDTLCLWPRAA
jgi:hypothetical protein